MDEGLSVFVVYERPTDYPADFVVRRQVVTSRGKIEPDPEPWAVVGSLEAARGLIPDGLHRVARHPEDFTSIVEVWI
jgi:hypothetical protein